MMTNYNFESVYPMEATLYSSSRFQLGEEWMPFRTEFRVIGGTPKEVLFNQWMVLIGQAIQKHELIHTYKFYMMDDILMEHVRIGDEVFTLYTKTKDIQPFLHYIFPLNGVLLFGIFDNGKEMLCRDDVCNEFAHEIYKDTNLVATWWEDNPYVNHYFVFPKSERDKDSIDSFVALGGDVPFRFSSTSYFYLVKTIKRNGKESYIKSTDTMEKVEDFERAIVDETIRALQKNNNIKFQIVYQAE